ncbi:MAG: MFS family transporter [Acetobacteraceae bacterium]|nr:MFS family transporter [Acetobacteraceae bacterium]
MSLTQPTAVQDGAHDLRHRVAGVISASAGNLIEWFDFFVYAYTAIYFAGAFFPKGDKLSQLLSTAGVFAVGFFMRPVGGWLFGWIADTRGRKLAMMLSVSLMSIGSLLVAVLPTYAQIGLFAPALLVIARLMQGLSVGAEYGTGATYISEVATKGRRGFWGSFQYFTIVAGQLLALLTLVVLQQLLSVDELKAWGWRIPFVMGALSALVVIYLRRSMTETTTHAERSQKKAGSLSGMMQHPKAVLLVLAFTGGGSLYFYTFTTYMQKFLVISAGIKAETASLVMTAALIVFMVAQPLFGLLSDRLGVRTHMRLFTGLAAVLVVPIMMAIQHVSGPFEAFALVVAGLLINAFYTPIAGLVKADLFPKSVRALGVGFPYALANAMFGGTAEYAALWLRSNQIESAFFYYVAALSVVGLIAAWMMPDLAKHGYLDGDGEIEANIGLGKN